MADVLADLDRLARGGSPVGPPVPSLGHVLTAWSRRRPAFTAGLGLLLLAGFGGVVWGTLRSDGTASPPDGTRSKHLRLVHSFRPSGLEDLTLGQVGPYGADAGTAIYQLTPKALRVFAPEGHELLSTNLAMLLGGSPEDSHLVLHPDLNGRPQVAINWIDRTNVYCGLLDQGTVRKRFRAEGSYTNDAAGGTKDFNTRLHPFCVTRPRTGGRPVLLAALHTGRLRQPRAAVCFDYESQELLWRYDVGPQVSDIRVVDTNGQGGFAVVFGGSAVNNGHRGADGTDDSHSYLWWLDANGKLANRVELGPKLSYATAFSAEWDDHPGLEVLAHRAATYQYPGTNHQESGALLVFAGDGTRLYTKEFEMYIYPFLVADLDGDRRDEVLTTDRLGYAHLLKSDFAPPRKRIMTNQALAMLTAQAALDLEGNSKREVLLYSASLQTLRETNSRSDDVAPNAYVLQHNALVVLDHELKELDRFEFVPQWKHYAGSARIFACTRSGQRPLLVVLADKVYVFEYLASAAPDA
jgi:hypothetical protein